MDESLLNQEFTVDLAQQGHILCPYVLIKHAEVAVVCFSSYGHHHHYVTKR